MRYVTALAVLMGLVVAPASALASPVTPDPAASAARIGSAPRLPAGARSLGALSGSAAVEATVTLASRDPQGLSDYARAVATPGSPDYHRYLTVGQFAERFGAGVPDVDLARAVLAAEGLHPGVVGANHLSIPVRGSAAQLAAAFSTAFVRYRLPGGRTAYANRTAPELPTDVIGTVQGVLGLDTLGRLAPAGLTDTSAPAGRRAADTVDPHIAGAPAACTAASSLATSHSANTAAQIASANGLNDLYAAGVLGAGQTVALYELEPYGATDVAAYQNCYGTNTAVTAVTVDGGPLSTETDTSESDLDIEDVVGLAPHAAIQVYQGPNTGSGAYDTLARIVTDDTAKVVSTSWGECETDVGSTETNAENLLFQEAAAQGQSVVAASGDNGADDCQTGARAVDDPSSQPFVTGVGGTHLSTPGAATGQTVWSNTHGAGGGGVSRLWPQPSYQSTAAQAQTGITCAAGLTACREVPDVSADADPTSGYVIRDAGAWYVYGGTSAAAPTWAALVALANASPACAPGPIGFLNPGLYAAGTADFTDVTSGTNVYGPAAGYAAGPGYDMASGLGAPGGPQLAAALCGAPGSPASTTTTSTTTSSTTTSSTTTTSATSTVVPDPTSGTASTASTTTAGPPLPTVAVARSRPQRGRVGVGVRLPVIATDSAGLALRYAAIGLPAGLHIDGRSGLIAGTPSRAGVWRATITASDNRGASAAATVRWTVAGAPSVLAGSLQRDRGGRLRLTLTVAPGARAPAIASVSITAPRARLRFASRPRSRGITVAAGGRSVRATARVRRGSMVVALRSPAAGRVVITVAAPCVVLGPRGSPSLPLTMVIVDAGGQKTTIFVEIASR